LSAHVSECANTAQPRNDELVGCLDGFLLRLLWLLGSPIRVIEDGFRLSLWVFASGGRLLGQQV
jgi:hypothetical protein